MAAAFLKAVLAGTIAAASAPSLLLTVAAISNPWRPPDATPLYAQLGIAFAVALGVVSVAAIVVGLPARLVMRRLGLEGAAFYVLVGAIGGAGFVAALLAALGSTSAIVFLPFAAFSGAATGYTWWRAGPGRGVDVQPAGRIERFAPGPRASSRGLQLHRWPTAAGPWRCDR